jgi:single-strand DNA-binding protein
MAGWAQTIIVGNVGRDVTLRYTQAGVPVADFSVAVTRRFGGRDGAEPQEKTTWYKVTCWRNLAEIANSYVKKGMQVMVVGTVEVSAYLDKSGQPAATLELTANNFQMLGSRADREGGTGGTGEYEYQAPADNIGDIPF